LNFVQSFVECKVSLADGIVNVSFVKSKKELGFSSLFFFSAPRNNLPPLLLKLTERQAERLDYLGVSFGATEQLVKFWRKSGYVPVYLRQTANDLTGEHSCIMLKTLSDVECEDEDDDEESRINQPGWLREFWLDFRRRFVSLLGLAFRKFTPKMALTVFGEGAKMKVVLKVEKKTLSKPELVSHLSPYDVKRLEMYSKNLTDYHLITDLLPTVGRLYFLGMMGDVKLSAVQSVSSTAVRFSSHLCESLLNDHNVQSLITIQYEYNSIH
jgi:N-acetyltransferase 10